MKTLGRPANAKNLRKAIEQFSKKIKRWKKPSHEPVNIKLYII